MANDALAAEADSYLKDVSSAAATAIANVIKHPFVLTSTTDRDANEDELDNYGPGARVESVKHQGILYDFIAQKEKGQSKTIKMELRQR